MPCHRPLVILQVEDTPSDVLLTARAMELCEVPHLIHVVSDGKSAIEFLTRQGPHEHAPRPDLILLDLELPRLSGTDVLEFVKNNDALKSIPVIIFSTCEAAPIQKHAYDLHANSYVVKPSDLETFTRRVQSIADYWCNTSANAA
jgi:CheY-like chemotaxis protein